MAALEVLALVENSPGAGQGVVRVPATGSSYAMPRKLAISPEANDNALAISGYSLTGANAQSLFDLAGTWNTSGTPTALKLNITDTASNSASRLLDLQVGGSTFFYVRKNGFVNSGGGFQSTAGGGGGLALANDGAAVKWGSSLDVALFRDAAQVLAQRNGANPQAYRLYNTYTDGSNYERFGITWTGNRAVLANANAGTGSARGITIDGGDLILSNLPTSDPAVAGRLWSNLGILTVSAG